MSPVTCTRRLEFDAGHRVLGHGGKCRHLHGHRYVVDITASPIPYREGPVGNQLDHLGMVVDFSVLKERIGTWIDKFWDHNILLNCEDPLVDLYRAKDELEGIGTNSLIDTLEGLFAGKDPFIFPPGVNPTAETMALFLRDICKTLLIGTGVSVTHVRVYETPNCWSDA